MLRVTYQVYRRSLSLSLHNIYIYIIFRKSGTGKYLESLEGDSPPSISIELLYDCCACEA